ncbi:MAG: hypothetical protein KBA53_04290 [Thermoclostridium sp.]|nr:hypothetical protein [Thermoclostridium sp.]
MNKAMVPLQQIEMSGKKTFSREMTRFVLFIFPIAYLAIISAVIVHEVAGHGLVASLLGGKFTGFGILVDGMGWAFIDFSTMGATGQVLVLLAGAFFTNLFAAVFFTLAIRFSEQCLTSMTFLVFAFAFLMDGVPYFFWDAIYAGGIGDISNILKIYPSDWVRGITVVITGLFGLAGIFLFNWLFFKQAVSRFASKEPYRLRERIVIASVLFIIQVLGWVSFDWNQLIPVPELGALPTLIPIALTFAVLFGILLYQSKKRFEVPEVQPIRWKASILIPWCVCILLVSMVILWFQNGVYF